MGNNRTIAPVILGPVIYYLFLDEEIVYIGMSKGNFHERIASHVKSKEFNRIEYRSCEIDEISKLESKEIEKHLPRYNIKNNGNRRMSGDNARRLNDLLLNKDASHYKNTTNTKSPFNLKTFMSIVKENQEKLLASFTEYTVANWLLGYQRPTRGSILRACSVLGISPQDLLIRLDFDPKDLLI